MNFSIWWLVAIIGGSCAAFQSSINGTIAKKIGTASTMTLSTLVFSFICAFYFAWEAAQNKIPWNRMKEITPVDVMGGVFGFLLVLCLTFAFPRLGALYSVVLMILGQCLTALLIDKFGLFGMTVHNITATRVAAIVCLLAGVFLLNK